MMEGMKSKLDKGSINLLCGPSGTGKTYISSQLAKEMKVIHLDKFGDWKDGKWIVDFDDVKKEVMNDIQKGLPLIEGISDNISAIHDFLKIGKVLVPKPDLDSFTAIQEAKFRDGLILKEEGSEISDAAFEGWKKRSSFNGSDYDKWIDEFVRGKLDSFSNVDVIDVEMSITDEEKKTLKGWH
jgi:energy-coupling factor transporter ATP-binding protein EcfA2